LQVPGFDLDLVFHGNEAPAAWRTCFSGVDLSGAKLVDPDFRIGLKREQVMA
jgi:hypothetical protein